MPERVPPAGSRGNSSTNRGQGQPRRPTETPGMDQSAAEFAALLGSDSDTNTRPATNDPQTPSNSDLEADGNRGREVEERRDEGQQSGGDSDERSDDSDGKREALPTAGDAILQAFSKGKPGMSVQGPQGNVAQTLDGIAQQIADKILVSDLSGGGREVRIFLKDSVLPGTEIRIMQDAGKLQIQMMTDSAKSHELLASQQAALQKKLTEKLSEHDVVVDVQFDSQRHGDDTDGRSKQQRDLKEEMEGQE